jgi:hypothetical protein
LNELEGFGQLQPLLGCWTGTGRGSYPTIPAFEYLERLRFVADPARPLIHYEQFTRQRGAGEDAAHQPSHWESGFLRAVDGGALEWSNAQDGGRVEVLRGPIASGTAGLQLDLESLLIGHDPRLVGTRRRFRLAGEHLHYEVDMHTTRTASLILHLEADLVRAPDGFPDGSIRF